ncbi:hypothetical protein KM043_009303 [Ampulex compressa]|nr:hypothetical protein KM043_009303 [Ampulex compressa]
MQRGRVVVKCITANNCFAFLPDTWLGKLETKDHVIEILHNGTRYYASCIARPISDDTMYLGTTFARSLNIQHGDVVIVSFLKDVPRLSSITVVPYSTHDRQILELQMDKVQSTLLNQVRIVAKQQALVIWVSKFSCVTVTTVSLDPNCSYGQLEQFTEVHVSNEVLNSKSIESKEQTSEKAASTNNLRSAFRKMISSSLKESNVVQDKAKAARDYELLQSFCRKSRPRICRVHYLPKVKPSSSPTAFDLILQCPSHVFVPRTYVPKYTNFTDGFAMFTIKRIDEDRQQTETANTNTNDEEPLPTSSTELIVKLFILEDVLDANCDGLDRNYFNLDSIHSTVYISESLRLSLKLKVGSKVILHQLDSHRTATPSSMDLFASNDKLTVEAFENYAMERSKESALLLNSCSIVALDDERRCTVRFSPQDCKFAMIDDKLLKNLRIHLKSTTYTDNLSSLEDRTKETFESNKISTRHLQNILEECDVTLELSLNLCPPLSFKYDRENILLCGDLGSGKTTFCKIVMESLRKAPHFVHTHFMDCRSLKGKKMEILQKLITAALSECAYYQPSVLFLDDLESITSASSNDEETTPDAINAARISDMLVNTVSQYQESHYLSIIGTCASANRIGQKLRPARGAQFFRTVLSIPNLEKADRIDILRSMLEDKLYAPGDVNWDYYGNKTEGWMAQDIVDMADKATFAAWKRDGDAKVPIVITDEDVSSALNNSTPMSLQDVNLYKGSGLVWSDIGGLADVKTSLIEILQWPLKYVEIFKKAPIKLQNGVLLYGMPGTGKTMLAKAIANECGVNLISVKGPELLSKYIGVSEESVRNIFEKAQRAKPCVLFFDEFDSLAPRRGHDSTGVTDRVVNQLLTQLDGVEDREGVAVVAASSRPDLLDPALLRPGRLDKALHCPLPNEADRKEILEVICKSHKMDIAELDFEELVGLSSGFTGADLNAAVTQARLTAFEDAAEKMKEPIDRPQEGKLCAEDIKVTQKQLVDAVKSTRPSLTDADKLRYNNIYARFSRVGDFTEDILRNQKATLA